MKTKRIPTLLGVVATVMGLDHAAHAQFNTLEIWGNANGTTPAAGFTDTAGTIAITAGGTDFYGNPDNGVMLWDNTGAQTTTGDFTATVRHVSTNNPAPEWGRDGIMVRATQSEAALSANDAYWLACRKSNGQLIINRRPTAGALTYRATDIGDAAVDLNTDNNDQALASGNVSNTPVFLSAARAGERLYSGFAMDLGGGVAGRWVEKWSTDNPTAVGGLQGTGGGTSAEVVVGLAHQSHPQTITPDSNDINTATFDKWTYSGAFAQEKFGPAAGVNTWQVTGTVSGDPATGYVNGSAFVSEGGAATGEAVKWTVSVYPLSSFVPKYGTSGTRKDPTGMSQDLAVPADNFRQGGEGFAPGLTADIYLDPATRNNANNAGNLAGNLALMTKAGVTKTSVVIPSPYWKDSAYPQNGEGENIFAAAFPEGGLFGGNESFYGVEMKGQIFIPGDATRVQPDLPGEFIIFKDGTDDFVYLEIDGKPLFNDNDWTGLSSLDNAGGNLSVLDVSDAKYNDGEWVAFRMIMWEGEGGDNTALYWDQNNPGMVEPVFNQESVPGTFGNLVPKLGVDNARKDPTVMGADDLVPASDFRHPLEGGGTAAGLKADIYLGGNPGNIEGVNAAVANPPASSVVLPNINWWNSAGQVNYPASAGGSNIFADAGAVLEDPAANGYSNYGVNLTGEIFIPGDAQRTVLPVTGGNNLIVFKDGVDDFTYLEIDGQVLTRDNDWTGPTAGDNGGGHATLMDVSDPKFDDGEWVPFRMTTWEGGGGDSGTLYWSARDTNGSFGIPSVPGSTAPFYQATGVAPVGSDVTEGRFGDIALPAGDWLLVLDIANTGTTRQRLSTVSVAATTTTLELTNFTFDPATSLLNMGFVSVPGSRYALEYTTGFQAAGGDPSPLKWNVVPTHSNILAAGTTTNIVPLNTTTLLAPAGQLPNAGKCFFRIRGL